MIQAKSFIITGETTHRDGKPTKDLDKKVDATINAYVNSFPGATYKDLKIDTKVNPGVGTDVAFVTVVLDVPEGTKAEKETISSKKK